MTFDVSIYEKLALVTENKSLGEVSERLSTVSDTVLNHITNFIKVAELLDIDKKKVFYGRNFEAQHEKKAHELLEDPAVIRLLHAIIGIATESAELFESFVAYINGNMLRENFIVNLKEESGDVEWYQALLHDVIKTETNEVRIRNLEKLLVKRYGIAFSEKAANNRNIDAELEALKEKGHTLAELDYKAGDNIYDNFNDKSLAFVAQTKEYAIFSTLGIAKEEILALQIKDGKLLSPYIVAKNNIIVRYALQKN